MRYVVGYAADDHGREALELGAWLARQNQADLTIGYSVPDEFTIASRVDGRSSFPTELHEQVQSWLDEAAGWLRDERGVTAETRVVPAASPARGLVALATEVGASMIVLGSSRRSALRHFAVGTVSGRLMHSSPVALALAPRGLALPATQRVSRVWCGQAGTARSEEALAAAVQLARRTEAPLRLVSFVLRDGIRGLRGADAELVVTRHRERAEAVLDEALADAKGTLDGLDADSLLVEASDIDAAFEELTPRRPGQNGDVLVLGSSDAGPVERVFFGGTASQLLRHCPWPVVAVPRGGADQALDVTGYFEPVDPAAGARRAGGQR